MAAYAAVVPLKRAISLTLKLKDGLADPHVINIMKSTYKELESFQDFVERLDSEARKKMSASLRRGAEAIRKFENEEMDHESMMELLKKVREEYHNNSLLIEASGAAASRSKRVGLSDVWTKLKEDLLVPNMRKDVFDSLTLVGMAGVGKTALARQVFQDLDIVEWFDCRVWMTVGIERKPDEIAEAILAQVDPDTHKMNKKHEEIALLLKQSLTDKRFLIVLDDVWDDIRDYMKASLPNTKNGSQVLVTTRNGVIDQPNPNPFEVRLLNKEESWHLLRDRVFCGDPCPPQLEVAGKKMANKCDGLPLTIVTVADLLLQAEEPLDQSLWIDVATKKRHPIFMEAYDKISEVLYPSFMQLGEKHKACFSYMGLFPLKFKIPWSKLINLWIVEDIIPQVYDDRTLEFHGAISLEYLIFQSLVMVDQRSTGLIPSVSSNRGIKTCRLHSSWWHFCQREARRNNTSHVLDCFDDAFEEGIQSQGWLSMHNNVLLALKDVHHSIEENCATTAQTLLCFGPYNQYMVPMCFGLKFLRRLDALNIRFYDFPLEVLELTELRYLAMTCNGELPPSISKLRKLIYLTICRHSTIKSCGFSSCLPMEIWDMKNMRYLRVMGCDLPDIADTPLPELTTLLDVTTNSCNVLKRVSNLKKLGIRIELNPDHVPDPSCCFDHISHVSKLESLKCVVMNPYKFQVTSFPCLPFSLRKLSLSGLGYRWKEMRNVASLPNLETLKIRYNAFQGPTWEVEESGFPKLHLLQIEDIDLVKLKFARGSFKCLFVLRLKHCYKLKELRFDNQETVRDIEIYDCNPLVERSIKENIEIESSGFLPMNIKVHNSWESRIAGSEG